MNACPRLLLSACIALLPVSPLLAQSAADPGTMSHGSMQGGSAPADARDPHAYSGGQDFGPLGRPRLADEHNFGALVVERLEAQRAEDETAAAYEVIGWYGRDYDRAVLKAEGHREQGRLQEARTELLWSHAVAAYWDAQLGARYDSGAEPGRGWLAVGVQGLAPYWFHVDATAYAGANGRTALRVAAEYESLLTQRWVLAPRLEANAYGKEDAERGEGRGLSDMTAGLRLRYEIRREFAPYLGIERTLMVGATAELARAAGRLSGVTRAVAGIRFWF